MHQAGEQFDKLRARKNACAINGRGYNGYKLDPVQIAQLEEKVHNYLLYKYLQVSQLEWCELLL